MNVDKIKLMFYHLMYIKIYAENKTKNNTNNLLLNFQCDECDKIFFNFNVRKNIVYQPLCLIIVAPPHPVLLLLLNYFQVGSCLFYTLNLSTFN